MARLKDNSSSAIDKLYKITGKELCSRQLYLFLYDYHNTLDAFFFFVRLAVLADDSRLKAAKALFEFSQSDKDRTRFEEIQKEPEPASKKLQEYSWHTSKNLTNSIVDAYLCFISASIQRVLRKQPDAIKSNETIRVEEILNYQSKRELIDYLVDRKVNSLSYGGIGGIEKFVMNTLGLEIFENEDQKKSVLLFNEIRNINTHNRGFVNKVFSDRAQAFSNEELVIGERAHVDLDQLSSLSQACVNSAVFLDQQMAGKFHIQRKRYSTWRNRTLKKTL